MKKTVLLFMMCILALSSLNAQTSNVPYTLAKNYFVKNTYPEKILHMLKITEQEKFDEIFGMAPLMGKDGMPTEIDFSKSYVVAFIDNLNNTIEDVKINSIIKTDNQIQILYTIKDGNSPAGMFNYCKILIIDKKYLGEVIANPKDKNITGGDMDENGCKPSTGYSWSVIENDCIQPWVSQYVLKGNLNYSLLFNKDNTKAEIMGLNHMNKKFDKNLILTKSGDIWSNGEITLIETDKHQFILKDNDKEILKGSLRE